MTPEAPQSPEEALSETSRVQELGKDCAHLVNAPVMPSCAFTELDDHASGKDPDLKHFRLM